MFAGFIMFADFIMFAGFIMTGHLPLLIFASGSARLSAVGDWITHTGDALVYALSEPTTSTAP
jgi:hypothetical protein